MTSALLFSGQMRSLCAEERQKKKEVFLGGKENLKAGEAYFERKSAEGADDTGLHKNSVNMVA